MSVHSIKRVSVCDLCDSPGEKDVLHFFYVSNNSEKEAYLSKKRLKTEHNFIVFMEKEMLYQQRPKYLVLTI